MATMFDLEQWANDFMSTKQFPMNEQQSKVLLAMLFHPEKETQDPFEDIVNCFPYQVGSKRAEVMGLPFTPGCMVYLCLLITDRPGSIVMYLSLFKFLHIQRGLELNIGNLCSIFPNGFPDEEGLQALWLKQKVDGANALDMIDWS